MVIQFVYNFRSIFVIFISFDAQPNEGLQYKFNIIGRNKIQLEKFKYINVNFFLLTIFANKNNLRSTKYDHVAFNTHL